jgi:hypothetical protein
MTPVQNIGVVEQQLHAQWQRSLLTRNPGDGCL